MYDTDANDTNRDQFHHETNAADPDYANDGSDDDRDNHGHDNDRNDRLNRRHSRKGKRTSMKYDVIPTIAAVILATFACLALGVEALAKTATRPETNILRVEVDSTTDTVDLSDADSTFTYNCVNDQPDDSKWDNDWQFGNDEPFFFDAQDNFKLDANVRDSNTGDDSSFDRFDLSDKTANLNAFTEERRFADDSTLVKDRTFSVDAIDTLSFNDDNPAFDGTDRGYIDGGNGGDVTFDQCDCDAGVDLSCKLDVSGDRFFFEYGNIDR